MARFPDILPNRKDDALVVSALAALAIGVGAHTFIGPAADRAKRFGETAPLSALVLTALFPGWGVSRLLSTVYGRGLAQGEIEGEKRGIAIGYSIPNPDLAPARDALIKAGTAVQVAQAARELIGDERLPDWAKPVGKALDAAERVRDVALPGWADPVAAEEVDAPPLPPGWTMDDDGRLHDQHGRYARPPQRG